MTVAASFPFGSGATLNSRPGFPSLKAKIAQSPDIGVTITQPEIAAQFKALVNAGSGSSDAVIHSAFAIDGGALAGVVAKLERRFGRKLNARVEIDPQLIGGIRVVVGDEVLDTSVKARLEQMKIALTA